MERTLELKRSRVTPLLFGIQDANLRYLEEQLGVRIRTYDTTVTVVGESCTNASHCAPAGRGL